uniref:TTF-type domain-containing protein n=2 Tax=Nothobranchius kuhntae TaxID=321403 RepID=A0A1A8IJ03_NOTKU
MIHFACVVPVPLAAEKVIEYVKEDDVSEEREGDGCSEGSEDDERPEEEDSERLSNTDECLPEDPGLWPEKLTGQQRDTVVRRLANKSDQTPGIDKITPKDMEGKPFPNYLQYAKSANGREKIRRDWLIYSESAKDLYCIPCLLFSHEQTKPSKSALNSKDGLKLANIKWKKMYGKLPEHETNAPHKQCYLKWKSLQHSLLAATGVDGHLQKQMLTEVEKNKMILERLLDVTLHLASRNLAFRGKTSNLDDVHNGNFLGTLELLSHYDPLLHEHLEKIRQKKKGARLTHYLSAETQNEFIELCGKRVLNAILAEREDAIYYSVICDSTPDISHTEQNVLLVRYVHQHKDSDVWEITERFIHKKTGREVSQMIQTVLKDSGISLDDCRGQGYDNGANMSGKVKGVQAQILQANPLATYSPCASHTLNLVGTHAAESCPEVSTFFGCINRLYNLFSASPERWVIFKEKTGCSLHRLSDTRWSARIAAVRVVATHLPSIIEALECILATCNLTSEAKFEANGLKNYFMTFDAVVLLTVWVKVLQSIENRNLILQAGNISLDIEAANIKALQEEIQAIRNEWSSLLAEASLVAQAMEIPVQFKREDRRKRKRKCMPDEMMTQGDIPEESAEDAFRYNIFFVAMDAIISDF